MMEPEAVAAATLNRLQALANFGLHTYAFTERVGLNVTIKEGLSEA